MTNRFFFTSTSIRYILPVVSTIVATQHSFCDFESNLGKGPKTTKGTRDPLACGNPICSDKMSMFNLAKEQVNQKTNKKADESLPKASSIPSDSIESQKNPQQCPLDKNELGRYTWSLLHTMAAYYPELPTEEQQNAALQFISSLALLYPCPHCAADFREAIKLNPPRVANRKEFSIWICQQHNQVNEKLGSSVFPCNVEDLDNTWKKGVPGCWNYVAGGEDDDAPLTSGMEKNES